MPYICSCMTTVPLSLIIDMLSLGLSRWCSGKESASQCRRLRCGFDPWVGKISWRRTWQPTPVFLPGEHHGQRSLAGYSSQGYRESDIAEVTGHTCRRFYHPTSINGEILKTTKATDILKATIEHLHLIDVYRTLC